MLDIAKSFRWQDLFDIVIVSYIIYRVMLLIRGTRAVQMLVGIVVLIFVYFVARELEFLTLYWLLGSFLSSIFLVTIIIFQRDIRRALTEVGQTTFTKLQENTVLVLVEVVKAALYMSHHKIGALIVIERETGLKDYIESGHELDAIVSRQLLISIFQTTAPLHDGAVIIRDRRIRSAGALLPLTKNPYISKQFGTRHRAAIGISEETDAVVVVVSEETQKISLVMQGTMTSDLDENALRNQLEEIFALKEKHNPTIVEKLVQQMMKKLSVATLLSWQNNWALKLISIIFAVLLWYFVVGEDKVDTTIYIPVEIVNLPRELVISNQFKKQLEATVSGPRGLINGLNRQPITRTINLSKATPGTIVIRNEQEAIQFPRGVNVLRIQPTHLTLVIDELLEKELPIKAVTSGNPSQGFELESIGFEPASIRIVGPKAIVGKETVLTTRPINLHGLKESTTLQIPLPLKPEILELIGETVVTANIVINEKTTPKIITRVPVQVSVLADGNKIAEIKPDMVSVHTILPLSSSRETRRDLVEAHIQAQNLPVGIHKLPVEIVAADHVKVLSVTPPNVTVRITR